MANPIKGEVAFEAGGKKYTFVLGTYALAALQRRSGMATGKFFNRPDGEWGIGDMLSVFHAGLLRHHKMMEEEAADLIDEIGQDRCTEIVLEAVELMKPKGGNGADPPQTAIAIGTGSGSSSSG